MPALQLTTSNRVVASRNAREGERLDVSHRAAVVVRDRSDHGAGLRGNLGLGGHETGAAPRLH